MPAVNQQDAARLELWDVALIRFLGERHQYVHAIGAGIRDLLIVDGDHGIAGASAGLRTVRLRMRRIATSSDSRLGQDKASERDALAARSRHAEREAPWPPAARVRPRRRLIRCGVRAARAPRQVRPARQQLGELGARLPVEDAGGGERMSFVAWDIGGDAGDEALFREPGPDPFDVAALGLEHLRPAAELVVTAEVLGAIAQHLEEREAPVTDRLNDQVIEPERGRGDPSAHKARAGPEGEPAGVEGRLDGAARRDAAA